MNLLSIAAVETQLLALLKAALAPAPGSSVVEAIESLAAEFDEEMAGRMKTPGVYVAFAGGGHADSGDAAIVASWIVYAATGHAGEEARRRHGDLREIGAYQLMGRIAGAVHGQQFGDAVAELDRVENLYTGPIDKRRLALYAVVFSIDTLLAGPVDPAGLAPFEKFSADWDLAPAASVPAPGLPVDPIRDARDIVQPEQPPAPSP